MVCTKKSAYSPEPPKWFPIQELPVELLSKIFVHCLDAGSGRDAQFTRAHSGKAPMLLTQVCSHWRRCALDTPQLWCSLEIIESNHNRHTNSGRMRARSCMNAQVAGVGEMWFSRAKALPLSIKLQTRLALHVDNACFTTLQSYFSVCVCLYLSIHDTQWLLVLSGVTNSVLDELTLSLSRYMSGPVLGPPMHIPRLRKLTLIDHIDSMVDLLEFSPAHLEELLWHGQMDDFTGYGSPKLPEFLRRCVSLTRCSVVVSSSHSGDTISLPKLEWLEIHAPIAADGDINLSPFLDSLHVPSLQNLELSWIGMMKCGTVDVHSLITMLARSGCSLKQLTIDLKYVVCSSVAEFGTLLRAMPHLEVMKMRSHFQSLGGGDSDFGDIFHFLTFGFAGEELLPNLSELVIVIDRELDFDEEPSTRTFEAILRSCMNAEGGRAVGVMRLRSFIRSALIISFSNSSRTFTKWWDGGSHVMRQDGSSTVPTPVIS
ncbi:hypothetical protein OE88DRAFT_383306 [Heliocybe sulcata]|uniref:Uncharacterized protein n=1 Tax=Heliocybe sulcata TaxID=5364 RepID=A0A5C3MW92_9AGAM|nr:hypothetical protein OE88DRAFT_383306 [Heliocybe sulcata]